MAKRVCGKDRLRRRVAGFHTKDSGECHMRPPGSFSGFSPAADPQEQVERAMTLLGRRPDLAGRLRIRPDPARKRSTGGWSVFGFRGSVGGFNESPHLLLHVADNAVCARVILPNKARGGLWTRLRSASWLT